MPCEVTRDEAGRVTTIICRRGQRRQQCSVPQCGNYATILCDYPVRRAGQAATCDLALCPSHAVSKAPGVDYCPAHAKMADSGSLPNDKQDDRKQKETQP